MCDVFNWVGHSVELRMKVLGKDFDNLTITRSFKVIQQMRYPGSLTLYLPSIYLAD